MMNVWDLILATVDEFGTNASGDQMCNYASWKWRHMLTKFATNKVTPVMVSTRGSVVPGNVYWHLLTFVDQEFCSKCSHRIFSIILTICKYKNGWPKLRNVADSAKIYNGWSKTCGRTQCYARLGTFGVNYNI